MRKDEEGGDSFMTKKWVLEKGIQGVQFVKTHRGDICMMAIMAAIVVIPHATGFCSDIGSDISTDMPWDTGVNKMQSALTGGIAKAGATVSIASSGLLWMFGQSDIAKMAMRGTLGSGVVLGAPTVVKTLSGVASGCLF